MLAQTKLNRRNCDQTPLSNTGSNSQTLQNTPLSVRPDWIQGTIRFTSLAQLHELIQFAEGYIKEKYVMHRDRGRFSGKQWHNAAEGIGGCLILYNLPSQEPDEVGHALVSFPATALSGISARDSWRLLGGLVNCWGFKATRFDIALDDFSKSITFEQISEAGRVKNYTGFRNEPAVHHTYRKGKIAGYTIVFGARDCDRLLRFYDKDFESKGKIKSNRLELELHDKLAEKAINDWLALEPEQFEETSPMVLAGMVVGAIDFIERDHRKNVARMPRLAWWVKFKEMVGMEIRHTVEAVVTSYEQKKRWLTRQVFTTLAMVRKVMGLRDFKQYLNGEMADGEDRFTAYHEAFIQVYRVPSAEMQFDWDVCIE